MAEPFYDRATLASLAIGVPLPECRRPVRHNVLITKGLSFMMAAEGAGVGSEEYIPLCM